MVPAVPQGTPRPPPLRLQQLEEAGLQGDGHPALHASPLAPHAA